MPAKTSASHRIFLNNVHLKGFKSIEDLSIDFQNGLNILIGKNGSGKSNFMEFLYRAIRSKRSSSFRYKYIMLEFISEDDHLFKFEFEKELNKNNENDDFDDRINLSESFFINDKIVFNSAEKNQMKNFIFKKRKVTYKNTFGILFRGLGYQVDNPLFIKFNLPADLECISTPGTLDISLEPQFFFSEHPKTLFFIEQILLKIESLYEVEPDKVITTVDILQYLKLNDEIIKNIQFYTTIEDVRFSDNISLYKVERFITIENIKLEFKINGSWLPWSQLSDGTKRLFYIIAEVTNTKGLVQIEEPELGIHPHQFNLLMDFLKEQSEDKQIIISTHSPKALDHLSADELNNILITYYDLKKGTQIRHLSEKEIKKAKKYMKEVGFFSDYWLLSDLEE